MLVPVFPFLIALLQIFSFSAIFQNHNNRMYIAAIKGTELSVDS
jgi:hypothetical protein